MGSRTSKEVALGAKDLSSQALSDDVRQVVIQANLHFGERHQVSSWKPAWMNRLKNMPRSSFILGALVSVGSWQGAAAQAHERPPIPFDSFLVQASSEHWYDLEPSSKTATTRM
jgi:hypothetical protein